MRHSLRCLTEKQMDLVFTNANFEMTVIPFFAANATIVVRLSHRYCRYSVPPSFSFHNESLDDA
ncbi:hypothetical protein GCM10009712_33940 [Pseudarthrobacter sulfonivorans]